MSLYTTIDNQNSDDLKKRISELGFSSKEIPSRKAGRVDFLHDYLLSNQLENIVKQLSDKERTMVAEVVHNQNGLVDEPQLKARYGSIPLGYIQEQHYFGRYLRWGEKPPQKVKSRIGALFFGRSIPSELCLRLSVLLPKPEADKVQTTEHEALDKIISASPSQQHHNHQPLYQCKMESAARHELFSLLRLIEKGKVSISEKTQKPSTATTKNIDAELYGGDFFSEDDEDGGDYFKDKLSPIRSYSWPLLIQTSGFTRRTGAKLSLTNAGKEVLNHKTPFAHALKQTYNGWRDQDRHDEMLRVNRIKGQTRRGKGRRAGSMMTPPSERHLLLEQILHQTPTGEWVQIDEWLRFVRSSGIPLSVSNNPNMLYLIDTKYGAIDYDFLTLEGRYIMVYLFEVLATLGMLDLVYSPPHGVRLDYGDNWGADEYGYLSRYDGLGWFRINPLGAYCLGLSEAYQPMQEKLPPLLHYNDGLSFSLLRDPEPHERMLLERFSTQASANTSTQAGERFQLDIRQGLDAIDEGHDLSELNSLLQKQSDNPIHEEVEDFLDSLRMRTSSLRNGGSAHIIECTSEHLVQLLVTSKETSRFCLFSGVDKVVVAEKSYRAFLKGVHKLGYRISQIKIKQ